MSKFTKRIRQKLGWKVWFKVVIWWKLFPPKYTPPVYDAEYFEAMRAFDDD